MLSLTTGVPNVSPSAAALARQRRLAAAIAGQETARAITPRSEQMQCALAQISAQAGDER